MNNFKNSYRYTKNNHSQYLLNGINIDCPRKLDRNTCPTNFVLFYHSERALSALIRMSFVSKISTPAFRNTCRRTICVARSQVKVPQFDYEAYVSTLGSLLREASRQTEQGVASRATSQAFNRKVPDFTGKQMQSFASVSMGHSRCSHGCSH